MEKNCGMDVLIGCLVICLIVLYFLSKNSQEEERWTDQSMVMYKDTLYFADDMPEGTLSYIEVGTIQSALDTGIPGENFQANTPLEGCKIFMELSHPDYVFVMQDEKYLPYKNIVADELLFQDLCESTIIGADQEALNAAGISRASLQCSYLSAMENAKKDYSQYYGGKYWSKGNSNNGKYVILLTEINDEITSFYNDVNAFGEDVVYKQCEISVQELETLKTSIVNYWQNYKDSDDAALHELMQSIFSIDINVKKNAVVILMENCTDEKIALFKEKVIDSEYVAFE